MALLDQLRDPLRPLRTHTGKTKCREEAKGAENPHSMAYPSDFLHQQVLDPVTSHGITTAAPRVSLWPQHHGGEEEDREDTSLPQPHIKELMEGEEKERDSDVTDSVFLLRPGWRREGSGLGHLLLVNTLGPRW